MTEQTLIVPPEADGMRADQFLFDALEITRSAAQRLLENGSVCIGKKPLKKSDRLSAGMQLLVLLPDPEPVNALPQNIPLDIVYEDNDLVVVNKPKGLVVHPAPGHPDGTLVNALLYHCGDSLSGVGGALRPGIVHRIDKDTSGLLLAAKNDFTHQALAEQLKSHTISRTYEAVARGNFSNDTGTIDAPIGRHPTDRKKMAVTPRNSRPAVTHYEVLARYVGWTHIRCQLETGRTHQIRVHMSHIGHPLMGDVVYGEKKGFPGLSGQCLHAVKLRFIHPRTGSEMELQCSLPDYFSSILTKLHAVIE